MELEGLQSLHHLKNSLMITDLSVGSNEGGSTIDDCEGRSFWATTVDRGGQPCSA